MEQEESATAHCTSTAYRRFPLLPLAELIPRIALLDRPEDGFLELLEDHVVGITDGLQLFVEVI